MSGACKFYWCKATACLAPQIVLEEIGLDYEIVETDIRRGEHRKPGYLALNPVGRVPTLVMPDGEVLYEAAAIVLHLAERHPGAGLAPPAGHPARGLFLRSLIYLATAVQTAYKPYYYPQRFTSEPAHAGEVKARAADNIVEAWRPVELHLAASGPFHLGPAFSAADIYALMLSTWFAPIGDFAARFPAIAACCARVAERPAVARCLEMQGQVGSESGAR